MPFIKLNNDGRSRILHEPLYKRLLTFCQKYCPEQPAEAVVDNWLSRLFTGDTSIHILINLDDQANIIDHAVIEVQRSYSGNIVIVHQTQHDTVNLANLDEGDQYVKALAAHVNAETILCFVTEHTKALQERYGYAIARVMLVQKVPKVSQEAPSSLPLPSSHFNGLLSTQTVLDER